MDAPCALAFWSGGKDSAWALHTARQQGLAEPVALLTTYSSARETVPLQEIPLELIRAQAAALDLPLVGLALPEPCPNEQYTAALLPALEQARKDYGITHVLFGDLHLADIRAWREALLAGTGLTPLFPLWGRDTAPLAQELLAGGLKAFITCIDTERLPLHWLGREFDQGLLADIARLNGAGAAIDPCGEQGEFHTYVYAAPGYNSLLGWRVLGQQQRDSFASLLLDGG